MDYNGFGTHLKGSAILFVINDIPVVISVHDKYTYTFYSIMELKADVARVFFFSLLL